jgi:hypothetical protein
MVFSLEHDIKVTKNHLNLLPTQSVLVAYTVELDKISIEPSIKYIFRVGVGDILILLTV